MAVTSKRLETGDGAVVADRCAVADGFGGRFMGLMFRRQLPAGEGLCIQRCNSIHMFFMRFPLDVAFVDGEGRVLFALHGIRPWRVSRIVSGAKAAIELPAGTLRDKAVEKGTILRLA
jgi:uncharacterized membrane protein (UPF0127 family)